MRLSVFLYVPLLNFEYRMLRQELVQPCFNLSAFHRYQKMRVRHALLVNHMVQARKLRMPQVVYL